MDAILEEKIHELEHRQIIQMGDLIRDHQRIMSMQPIKPKKGSIKEFFKKKEVPPKIITSQSTFLPPINALNKGIVQRYREEAMKNITESKELNAVLTVLYKMEGELRE